MTTIKDELTLFAKGHAILLALETDPEIVEAFINDFSEKFEELKPEEKPAEDLIYRIYYKESGKRWAINESNAFPTFDEARDHLLNHYAGTYNSLSRNPSYQNYYQNFYSIRQEAR